MALGNRFVVAAPQQTVTINHAHALPAYPCPVIPFRGASPIEAHRDVEFALPLLHLLGANVLRATMFIDDQHPDQPVFFDIIGRHGDDDVAVVRSSDAFVVNGGGVGQGELQATIDWVLHHTTLCLDYQFLDTALMDLAQQPNNDPDRSLRSPI